MFGEKCLFVMIEIYTPPVVVFEYFFHKKYFVHTTLFRFFYSNSQEECVAHCGGPLVGVFHQTGRGKYFCSYSLFLKTLFVSLYPFRAVQAAAV